MLNIGKVFPSNFSAYHVSSLNQEGKEYKQHASLHAVFGPEDLAFIWTLEKLWFLQC
jgi:hypothetical protein